MSIQVRHEDYEWLDDNAKSGVYYYAATLARYLLAEKISEMRKKGGVPDVAVPEESAE